MKIAVIGAGNMSEAILAGVIEQGVLSAEQIIVSDPLAERREHMQATYGVLATEQNDQAVATADVIMLAIKPQVFPAVWEGLQAQLPASALVVSIMAGISAASIEQGSMLRVVRVMPNTPSLVGRGAAGVAKGAHATDEDLALVERLMGAVGVCVRVEESQLHAVTALSGSGPAYLFYLMEAMIEAAMSLGLNEQEARLLCVETVGGAADLMAASDCAPSVLRERVTSKGGTTAAAIESLEEQQVDQAIGRAMQRAFQRSQELA
jgi:pyrroline-5-carboxylate reductase